MHIETKQQLDKRNLISFRKTLRATELQTYMEKMFAYVESCGAKKVGGGISATYAIDGEFMDFAMYIPIDKEIPSTNEFVFKLLLYLKNFIITTHKGNPQMLDNMSLGSVPSLPISHFS